MLQKEVVDRMAAQPGNQGLWALDRHAGGRRRGRQRCSMSDPAHFSRRPKVWSAIVRAAARRDTALRHRRDGVLRTLVTAAFSHRRKTLRNSPQGTAHVAGHRILRHRSAIAARNAGAGAIRPARRPLLAIGRLYLNATWPHTRRSWCCWICLEGSEQVAIAARDLAAYSNAAMVVLHVVEFVPVEPMGESLMPTVQIEDELIERAREQSRQLSSRAWRLPRATARVEAGNTKAEILRVAEEERADLIVLGSRERHGLAILVNFTEDTVLHAAHCDVLGGAPEVIDAGHAAEPANPKIRVEVETSYIEEQSDPRDKRFVFSYTITIRNEGQVPARLLTRHWIITDANGNVKETRGDGVVGEQPYLKPGQGFRYSSGAVIETPVGTMQGSYQMVADDGQQFDAPIAPFRLAMPGVLH